MVSFLIQPFLDFYEKTLVKRKRFATIVLTNSKNPEHKNIPDKKYSRFQSHLDRSRSFKT